MLIEDKKNISWLHTVRLFELEESLKLFETTVADKSILEIGSGTGFQLKILKKYSNKAVGVDIAGSAYQKKVSEMIIYDGNHLPFPDSSFDIIFSSNVLEHVKDINAFHKEIKRVLKGNGRCIHIMPSHFWRFWTLFFHYPWVISCLIQVTVNSIKKIIPKFLSRDCNVSDRKWPDQVPERKKITLKVAIRSAWFPGMHGERGNIFTEMFYFHPKWWRENFIENGWQVKCISPIGLFYWGHDLLRLNLPISYRQSLCKYFGSACYLYILSNHTN